jgi:hypothetical protein
MSIDSLILLWALALFCLTIFVSLVLRVLLCLFPPPLKSTPRGDAVNRNAIAFTLTIFWWILVWVHSFMWNGFICKVAKIENEKCSSLIITAAFIPPTLELLAGILIVASLVWLRVLRTQKNRGFPSAVE